jgi:hypothetical protein
VIKNFSIFAAVKCRLNTFFIYIRTRIRQLMSENAGKINDEDGVWIPFQCISNWFLTDRSSNFNFPLWIFESPWILISSVTNLLFSVLTASSSSKKTDIERWKTYTVDARCKKVIFHDYLRQSIINKSDSHAIGISIATAIMLSFILCTICISLYAHSMHQSVDQE